MSLPPLDEAGASDLAQLEARLGVTITDRALLVRALTHHSSLPESERLRSYDTLEFLGDALLGVQVVEYIYRTYPNANEGEMTALKSEVVSRRVLARVGERLDLDRFIRVDIASLRTFNERSRDSLRADVVEALVAAISLDQGRAAAEAFVAREILPLIAAIKADPAGANPKGALQQHIQRQMGILPRYETLAETGHDNDRRYTVGVYVGERLLATGEGSSIKEASREAASAALRGEPPSPSENQNSSSSST